MKRSLAILREKRDERQVMECLRVKIQHLKKMENIARREYEKARKAYKQVFENLGKKASWKNIIRRLTKINSGWYSAGMEKAKKKIAWSVSKIKTPLEEKKKQGEEAWVEEMARGRGSAREKVKIEVPAYDYTPSADELDALRLPHSFKLLPEVSEEEVRVQAEICRHKARWDRSSRDMVNGRELPESQEPLTLREHVSNEEGHEVINPEDRICDFTKLRPTNVKNNPRVMIPGPRPPIEEAELLTRTSQIEQKILGSLSLEESLVYSNITPGERRGILSLQKGVADGKIVVYPTDKSGKLAVASRASWVRQGLVHVSKDELVRWERVEIAQRVVRCHTRALNRIFKPGSSHGDMAAARTEEAKELRATTIPVFSLMAKDHKWREAGADPATRGVCGAARSINGELSEYLADILDASTQGVDTGERISTEDMLAGLDSLAQDLEKPGAVPAEGVTVCSIDAVALYPEIDVVEGAKIARKAIEQSKTIYEGVDYGWAGRYIALNCSPQEIAKDKLSKLVPFRKQNRGKRPTILTVDCEDKKERWCWSRHPNTFSPAEKRKLLGKVVEILVKVTFENHFYKWNNNIYRQTKGGPIGLRAAQSLARIIMDVD